MPRVPAAQLRREGTPGSINRCARSSAILSSQGYQWVWTAVDFFSEGGTTSPVCTADGGLFSRTVSRIVFYVYIQ